MACVYYVVPHADMWVVKFEDGEYGPYRNETDATDFAIESARRLGTAGERAEVFVLPRGARRIVRKYPNHVAKTSLSERSDLGRRH